MQWRNLDGYKLLATKSQLRNIISQVVVFQLFDTLMTLFPRPMFLNEKKIVETLQFLKTNHYQIIIVANSYDFNLIEKARKLITEALGWSPVFVISPRLDTKLFNFLNEKFFIKIRESFLCSQNNPKDILRDYNLIYMEPLSLFPHKKVYTKDYQELVIFVGMPGSGKSYTAGKMLKNNPNYVACDQDAMKNYTIEETIECSKNNLLLGKSVLVVTVNASRERRAKFMKIAKDLNIPVRILWFIRNGYYTNLQRGKVKPDTDITFAHKKPVPKPVFDRYYQTFQEPDNLEAPVEIIF